MLSSHGLLLMTGALVAAMALGCGLLNPAGARLEQAEEERATGEKEKALATLQAVVNGWPESPEASKAREEAAELEVELVRDDVAGGNYLGAARRAVALESAENAVATAAGREAVAEESPEFAAAVSWLKSESDTIQSRADLAIDLRAKVPALQGELDPWLSTHIGEAKADTCLAPISALDAIDALDTLEVVASECAVVVAYAPDSEAGRSAAVAIDEGIPARREAIKKSPVYRTEAALQTCRDYRSFVLAWRERLRARVLRGQDPMGDRAGFAEAERRQGELKRSVGYLISRLQSMPQNEEWYRLARSIDSECASLDHI